MNQIVSVAVPETLMTYKHNIYLKAWLNNKYIDIADLLPYLNIQPPIQSWVIIADNLMLKENTRFSLLDILCTDNEIIVLDYNEVNQYVLDIHQSIEVCYYAFIRDKNSLIDSIKSHKYSCDELKGLSCLRICFHDSTIISIQSNTFDIIAHIKKQYSEREFIPNNSSTTDGFHFK